MGKLHKLARPRRVLQIEMNKVDKSQCFASLKNNKVIKDYSSSTEANLNEVEERIPARRRLRIFKL